MIGSQGYLTVWEVPRVPCVLANRKMFSKWINFQITHCKKFHCPLSKISFHYQTMIDQRLDFICTLQLSDRQNDWFARPSDSLTDSLSTMCASTRSLKFFTKQINFEIMDCKTVHCPLSKISLLSLTASWSEVSSLSPTIHLDFSWTLEMSDQLRDRFARPSECQSSSLSTTWHHPEAPSNLILSKWMNVQTNH